MELNVSSLARLFAPRAHKQLHSVPAMLNVLRIQAAWSQLRTEAYDFFSSLPIDATLEQLTLCLWLVDTIEHQVALGSAYAALYPTEYNAIVKENDFIFEYESILAMLKEAAEQF